MAYNMMIHLTMLFPFIQICHCAFTQLPPDGKHWEFQDLLLQWRHNLNDTSGCAWAFTASQKSTLPTDDIFITYYIEEGLRIKKKGWGVLDPTQPCKCGIVKKNCSHEDAGTYEMHLLNDVIKTSRKSHIGIVNTNDRSVIIHAESNVTELIPGRDGNRTVDIGSDWKCVVILNDKYPHDTCVTVYATGQDHADRFCNRSFEVLFEPGMTRVQITVHLEIVDHEEFVFIIKKQGHGSNKGNRIGYYSIGGIVALVVVLSAALVFSRKSERCKRRWLFQCFLSGSRCQTKNHSNIVKEINIPSNGELEMVQSNVLSSTDRASNALLRPSILTFSEETDTGIEQEASGMLQASDRDVDLTPLQSEEDEIAQSSSEKINPVKFLRSCKNYKKCKTRPTRSRDQTTDHTDVVFQLELLKNIMIAWKPKTYAAIWDALSDFFPDLIAFLEYRSARYPYKSNEAENLPEIFKVFLHGMAYIYANQPRKVDKIHLLFDALPAITSFSQCISKSRSCKNRLEKQTMKSSDIDVVLDVYHVKGSEKEQLSDSKQQQMIGAIPKNKSQPQWQINYCTDRDSKLLPDRFDQQMYSTNVKSSYRQKKGHEMGLHFYLERQQRDAADLERRMRHEEECTTDCEPLVSQYERCRTQRKASLMLGREQMSDCVHQEADNPVTNYDPSNQMP